MAFQTDTSGDDDNVQPAPALEALMTRAGLSWTDAELEREWRTEVARIYPRIRGTLVPAPIFDIAVETLKAKRAAGS